MEYASRSCSSSMPESSSFTDSNSCVQITNAGSSLSFNALQHTRRNVMQNGQLQSRGQHKQLQRLHKSHYAVNQLKSGHENDSWNRWYFRCHFKTVNVQENWRHVHVLGSRAGNSEDMVINGCMNVECSWLHMSMSDSGQTISVRYWMLHSALIDSFTCTLSSLHDYSISIFS